MLGGGCDHVRGSGDVTMLGGGCDHVRGRV